MKRKKQREEEEIAGISHEKYAFGSDEMTLLNANTFIKLARMLNPDEPKFNPLDRSAMPV